jgi:sugar lactone lactonase YvrE
LNNASVVVDGLTFTEGIRWHENRVWFSDVYNKRVLSMRDDGSDFRVEAEVAGIPAGLGFLPNGDLLISEQDTQRLSRRTSQGEIVLHADLSEIAVSWANDLAVDADGTAYVGCFGFALLQGAPYAPGLLMKVSPAGDVTVVGEPMAFPNGCFITDDRRFIVAESMGNRISEYRIEDGGDLTSRRDWASFGPVPTAADMDQRYAQMVVAPDGISQFDAEGAIWVADFTKRYALRVLPGGEIVERVGTGDLNCYAPCLAGADGRTLLLCATWEEPDLQLRKERPRGTIQSFRVDVPRA